MQIIDDFVPVGYQERIKDILLGPYTPWIFLHDATTGSTGQADQVNRPALLHVIKKGSNIETPLYSSLVPMLQRACSMTGRTFGQVAETRSILQLPLSEKCYDGQPDTPHVDRSAPHFVILYYVVDSDGDTIIYDKRHERGQPTLLKNTDYPILHKITPKQGRAVVFDGNLFHTAEQPTSQRRCILNTNIMVKRP